MRSRFLTTCAIVAVAATALFHTSALQGDFADDGAELAAECKVVLVNGEADHCVLVVPGTDTPVSLPAG
jgi:hypothetical protein